MPIADCGHAYEEPKGGTGAAGYARDEDGKTFCYPCADDLHRAALLTTDRTGGYFKADTTAPTKTDEHGRVIFLPAGPKTITTWTGGLLGRVTYAREGRHNIGGKLWHLRVIDVHGAEWYGTSPGPGMYVRLRKCKSSKGGRA